jgi:hypothetical protein
MPLLLLSGHLRKWVYHPPPPSETDFEDAVLTQLLHFDVVLQDVSALHQFPVTVLQ